MFGARYFGHRFFGPVYFGDGSDTPPVAVPTDLPVAIHHKKLRRRRRWL